MGRAVIPRNEETKSNVANEKEVTERFLIKTENFVFWFPPYLSQSEINEYYSVVALIWVNVYLVPQPENNLQEIKLARFTPYKKIA